MTGAAPSFLATADRIGCRLCRDAVWHGERCNWLGWSMEFRAGSWAPAFRAMGALLYDGTAGIGLFLARLSGLTDDPIARATARGALAQALSAVDALAGAGEYGFYSGLSGIAHACTQAARLLDDAALAERGEAALLRAARIAPHGQRLDVINGSAGLIPALLAATSGPRGDEMLDAAILHGEQLLALADRSAEGWSWSTMGEVSRNLVGYSHGTTGIACALAELALAADRPGFLEAAREALRYERAHFRPAQGNWPDFRTLGGVSADGEPACMTAWCHGAPGIGLGRLRMRDALPDEPGLLAEAEIAVATTAASLTGPASWGAGNFSLCHGHAGNAELLILAADRLGRPELRRGAEELGAAAASWFEEQNLPWPCGVPGAGETPNLMLGLAGIGHFYLRLHDPETVPSVLSVCAGVSADVPEGPGAAPPGLQAPTAAASNPFGTTPRGRISS